MEAFISPVDGSLVRNKREYDDHNRRNGVVNAAEFTPEFYAEKAESRARHHNGEYTKAESHARKSEIYETMQRMERNGHA
jgi:hypothetical protein